MTAQLWLLVLGLVLGTHREKQMQRHPDRYILLWLEKPPLLPLPLNALPNTPKSLTPAATFNASARPATLHAPRGSASANSPQ
eukprot:CAMPEP_0174913540 /NCGR_PEP_ID=MMETSP0167-20121228/80375_1 /TAXON_ID=38298 /ORGANISM="Rhodella maculata, Strain CCMP736" /LENGTH=82 /DNA_ID=CAMNT_0016158265 /DNA_START=289 /DNA_END=537 /DNA_ORIENTATION=+